MTTNNSGLKGLAPAFMALLACYCVVIATSARTAAPEPSSDGEKWDDTPMIFAAGTLYESINYVACELPEGAVLLGTVARQVPQNEPMVKEELCANTIPAGTELYRDEADPGLLYVKLAPEGGTERYGVYQVMKTG